MKFLRPIAIAALASSFAVPALAERQETIYLNPFAGFQYFGDKRDLDESGTYGVGIEYRFLPSWAIETVYSRADAGRKYSNGAIDFDEVRVDGTYYFAGPDRTWNPYVSVGAGHASFDGTGPSTPGLNSDETRVNLGAGVRYNISDRVSLRGDLREFHGIDDSTFDTMASLGISVAFNRTVGQAAPVAPAPQPPADADNDGVLDARDQCPNTPRGTKVDANGCELDSDKDGVVDSKDKCPNTAAGMKVDKDGCEGVVKTIDTFEIDVQFPLNSAEIGAAYDSQIRRVADALRANSTTYVEIAGHTDSTGGDVYNQELSERRAAAVANRLTGTLGVNSDRVSSKGYGEAEPVASNSTDAGRAANRRVEARIQVRR
jgi:OOP family OmpA-OmpF porin